MAANILLLRMGPEVLEAISSSLHQLLLSMNGLGVIEEKIGNSQINLIGLDFYMEMKASHRWV